MKQERLLAGLALAVGLGMAAPTDVVAQDEEEASPIVQYRQSLMDAFRTHMGGVRAALEETAPLGHAQYHAESFERMALALADAFPDNTAGPGSRALPAIWSDHADFMDKVTAIQTATTELVAASRTGDPALIQPALQAVQRTCGGCHDTYRAEAN